MINIKLNNIQIIIIYSGERDKCKGSELYILMYICIYLQITLLQCVHHVTSHTPSDQQQVVNNDTTMTMTTTTQKSTGRDSGGIRGNGVSTKTWEQVQKVCLQISYLYPIYWKHWQNTRHDKEGLLVVLLYFRHGKEGLSPWPFFWNSNVARRIQILLTVVLLSFGHNESGETPSHHVSFHTDAMRRGFPFPLCSHPHRRDTKGFCPSTLCFLPHRRDVKGRTSSCWVFFHPDATQGVLPLCVVFSSTQRNVKGFCPSALGFLPHRRYTKGSFPFVLCFLPHRCDVKGFCPSALGFLPRCEGVSPLLWL